MATTKVQKRDGTIVDFEQTRITNAIFKSLTATGQGDGKRSKKLSGRVVQILNRRFKKEEIPNVEQIQDIVEEVLILEGLVETAKAYILYREQRRRVREAVVIVDESTEMVDKYLQELDWQVHENANMAYSLQGLNQYAISAIAKKYWLNKIYPKKVREAAFNEDFHIHDLETLACYCMGWDLYDLLLRGFGGVSSKIESKPAKHFRTALGQLVNFLFTLQGESAGANAVSNFDTLLSPFIRYDNLNYQQVKQAIQEFLFNCMVPTRVGFQTPFLNISLDIKVPEFYKNQPVVIGGKPQKETYGEFQEEMNILNRAFYEDLMDGDAKNRPFTFPIPTVSITKDFDWDNPNLDPMWEATAKYGVNYFSNFIHGDLKPEDFRSMCVTPDTQIIYQNTLGNVGKMPIRRIVEDFIKMENFGKVLMNGEFVEIKNVLRLVNKAGYVLKIILENGESFRVTPDHPSMIVKGNRLVEVQSEKLKVGDGIPIAKNPYKGELGDFDLGRFVGLYIAEGYLAHNGATTAFSFGSTEKNYFDFVTKFVQERFGARTTAKIEQKHQSLVAVINDRATGALVKSYVRGDNSLNKRLNSRLFEKSFEFRKGVLIGVLEGDGHISKMDSTRNIQINSSNSGLIDDVGLLCRSLGINYTKQINLNNIHFGVKFTSYKLLLTNDFPKWLGKYFNRKPGKSRIYKNYKNFYGIKIKSIEKNPYTDQVYDFETKNKEHLFQLANGVITHNCCRLRLSNKELYKRGGGGLFGSAPLTGCYDEKTEILTDNGWKFFRDLTKSDDVFTLTGNNEIELHKPQKIFQYDYEGELYHFKTKSLDLLVTPNHRMVIDHRYKNKRIFVEAKDFKPNQHRIPKQGVWERQEVEYFILSSIEKIKPTGPASRFSEMEIEEIREMKSMGVPYYKIAENFGANTVTMLNICTIPDYGQRRFRIYETPPLKIKMDDWLKFFGFWIAEGCTDNEKIAKRHGYRIVISQTNKQKREEIREVLDFLPFNYYLEGEDNFVITNKQLWTYLRQFGNKYQKFIPKEIKNLSKRQLKILFDWMVKGDGHIRKTNGQINYWTSSKKLTDDLQEIILKLGWLGTVIAKQKKVSQIKGRKIKAGIVYTIGVQKTKHYRLRKNNPQKVYYKGKVYCCEVKNHTVFVRRNGKVSWCGNSIGVCTINMPRIGYLSKTKRDFFERLGHLMNLAKESLEIKRKALENFMEKGLYPYSKYYLASVKKMRNSYFGNHFSTIGLMGMNEALLNFIGDGIASKRGRRFTLEVLDFMREKLVKYQEDTGNMYNLEATPGEGTSYRQARTDVEKYPDIITAGTKKVPYYTNSTMLPVKYTDDVFEALKLQDEIQCKYTGGVVMHLFLGEKVSDVQTVKALVKKIFESFHLPYITLTPTFSICPSHGYLEGEHFECPKCIIKQPCEVYSRVVGYLRPVQQWNFGKQQEFKERKEYKVTKTLALK